MSWRDWIDHGIEAQFNPRLAVGDEAESWLNGWAEPSGWIDQSWMMAQALLRRSDDLTSHISGGAHHFSLVDWLCNGQIAEGAKLHRWMAGR